MPLVACSARILGIALIGVTIGVAAACAKKEPSRAAESTLVERGAYLVTVGGCHDCHSPKVFTDAGPEPDTGRLLSGHPANAVVPPVPAGTIGPDRWGAVTTNDLTVWVGPWGVSYAANLTPDVTGLGSWTPEAFIQTMRTGKHLGVGRPILPPMPWFNYGRMTDEDLRAVFAYLKSLPPISNSVPAPLPPVAAQTPG